ncbi:MAG: archaeal proteasome endopeptidase complex subunit beta [Candidatus Methanosuratincola petrocarbonis]|nr:archaeal proteasome endopeptidase complex subunit beta [Candidatus Methanosuratincola sp.]
MPEAQFGYPVTGATTVGIACKDGVVLASEKRVTYGFSIMTKAGKKVFAVNDRLGVAFAGLISDSQAVLRRISAETNLYELETRKPMSVKAMAKILANLLYAQRVYPVFTETMVGGMDEEGAKLFVLDPLGSMIEDRYAALGTGGAIAIGIVESIYSPEMGVEAGKELAVKAVRAAIARDVASGDGVDVLVISKQGAREETLPAK